MRVMVERINQIVGGFRQSQVLLTANAANIFAHLEEPKTAGEIATALGWDPRGTRMLLDGLLAIELLSKRGGKYRNTEIASACLVPGKPDYQGDIVNHYHSLWESWSTLDEAVKAGHAVVNRSQRPPEQLRHFILGMSNIARYSAQDVLREVDFSNYRHMLDLGGGPATFSIAFLQKYPSLRATLFDLPDVVNIAKEQVEAAQLESRFDFIQGDMLENDIGGGYDLIFISNIIHSMGPNSIRALFKKCYPALEPRGRLIVKDFIVDSDRTGPPFSLLFALNMLVNTRDGDTYTYDELDEWTKEAGFSGGHAVDVTPQSRLWICEKISDRFDNE